MLEVKAGSRKHRSMPGGSSCKFQCLEFDTGRGIHLHAAAVVSCTPGPLSSRKVMIGTMDAVYNVSPAYSHTEGSDVYFVHTQIEDPVR